MQSCWTANKFSKVGAAGNNTGRGADSSCFINSFGFTEETLVVNVGDTALNTVQLIVKLKLINFHVSKDCLLIGGSGILLGICE